MSLPHAVVDTSWHEHRRASLPWEPPPVATTVVVPHPDDEALMFSALIRLQRRRGVAVHVIAVSDGEAAYPDVAPTDLADRRRGEQAQSLRLLGTDPVQVFRLSLPDGQVAEHESTIRRAIEAVGDPLVVAPWTHDHHCDHEACGRAAAAAVRTSGATLVAGLFWAWHHTPADLVERPLLRLALDDDMRASRTAAIRCHTSQLVAEQPVLNARLLEPATWPDEYYVAHDDRFTERGGR